jgi:hypothetical protein
MLERIVLTMGIASSTPIMEDLHRTGCVFGYKDLIAAFAAFLESNEQAYRYLRYKFVGEGLSSSLMSDRLWTTFSRSQSR